MNKSLIAALLIVAGLGLSACDPNEQAVLVNKYHIVDVPPQLYNCPVLKTFPQIKTLTDAQVARLLVQLRQNNLTCKQSLEGIRTFLAQAKQTVGR